MNERQPSGLGTGPGARLWKDVVSVYQLRPDELRVLEDACREANLIGKMERELSKASITVDGSMGQTRVHPLVSEIRQHRSVFAQLVRQLKLPDPDGAAGVEKGQPSKPASAQSDKARAIAHARWQR